MLFSKHQSRGTQTLTQGWRHTARGWNSVMPSISMRRILFALGKSELAIGLERWTGRARGRGCHVRFRVDTASSDVKITRWAERCSGRAMSKGLVVDHSVNPDFDRVPVVKR